MSDKASSGRESLVGKKLWVSYRLQSLTTERFISITNKILRGEHGLVKSAAVPPQITINTND